MSTTPDMQISEAMDKIEDLIQKVNATHQGWNALPTITSSPKKSNKNASR